MKNKIISSFIIFLTLFLSLSLVSACENVNDTLSIQSSSDNLKSSQFESEIIPVNITSYDDLEDSLSVKLISNQTPLENKQIEITLNNITYNKTTNSKGIASLDFKLKTGNYTVSYFFWGDENYTSSNATSTITVLNAVKTKLSVNDCYINFIENSKTKFQIQLTDDSNNVITGQIISITVDNKQYSAKTNSKGYATFYLTLKKGKYNIKYSFSKSGKYLSSSGYFKVNVKVNLADGYGYWLNKWDMKKVNLKKLYKLGTKHIFLQHTAVSHYGKSDVLKWITKAHKYGMKVHLWMAVFYKNGKFVHAASKSGKYNYKFINSIIKKAKYYTKLNGVDGIHFDYIRYGGNAYKYKNAAKAINYFVKKASTAIHKINPYCIVSAAIMPEPNTMKYHYGQDVSYMSKYMDVLIPMLYKGNYHTSSKWITKTTKIFVKKSNGAKIWAGLQTYKSDRNVKKISYSNLFKDAKAAIKGNALGIVLFRWGLSKLLNFKKL